MIKTVVRSFAVLVIAGTLLSVSPGRLSAQEPALTWLVVTFKLQLIEGRPMIQVMGPFPSGSFCDTMLKFIQEGVSRQGLEVVSTACRKDVTVVVPDQGAPNPNPPPPAPAAPDRGN